MRAAPRVVLVRVAVSTPVRADVRSGGRSGGGRGAERRRNGIPREGADRASHDHARGKPARGAAEPAGTMGHSAPTPDTEAHLRPVASRPCRQRADGGGRSCFAARELPQRRAIPAELGVRLPRLLALRDAAIEAPVGPERLYYLVEIVGQTKNAPCGQIGPALLEVVQDGRRPWHLEANHDCGQGSEIVRILV